MSEHLEVSALLEAREGRAGDRAKKHLDACTRCRRALEDTHQLRAQLRALSENGPPRDRWPEIRTRILAERRRTRRRRALVGLIAAASVLLGLWAVSTLSERAEHRREAKRLHAQVLELEEQSQLLDAQLRELAAGATSTRQAEALLLLEDGLRRIDDELASAAPVLAADTRRAPAPEVRVSLENQIALWSSRLELQGAMVQVHHTPLRVDTL